jgi:AAA+ superfamily predicted ATPase
LEAYKVVKTRFLNVCFFFKRVNLWRYDPVQRTMLEIVNQLDGFDARGNIKVLMATNRPDTLDPALLRPGRLDRKVEFGLPDLESRTQIFRIHTRSMAVERDIRYELLSRLCPNATGRAGTFHHVILQSKHGSIDDGQHDPRNQSDTREETTLR